MNEKPQYHPKSKILNNFAKLCIISFFLLFIHDSLGQTITFQKTIEEINIQYFWSAVQTPDNGYIAVGRKRISSFDYMYIVRFNAYGDTIWTKTVTGGEATCVIKTNDNYYALCGIACRLVKFDINGNILIYGSFFNEDSIINTIIQTPDGNYFMCGLSFPSPSHPYIIKFDSSGNFLMDTTYTDGIYTGYFTDIISSSSSIILTGNYRQTSSSTSSLFIMKLDYYGNRIFISNPYYEPGVFPNSLIETSTGSYVVCGSFRDNEHFLSKFKNNGTFEWIKAFDTAFYGGAKSITLASDGMFVFTGTLDSGIQQYARIRKTDTNGVEVWRKLHAIKNQDQICYDIKLTSDSGFVIAGTTGVSVEDIYLLKTDKNGDLLPPIGINPITGNVPMQFKLYQNYPNPFNPQTKLKFDIPQESRVKLIIYDILGREVVKLVDEELRPGVYSVTFKADNLPSGIYLAKLTAFSKNTEYSITQKLVLLK